MKKTLANKTKIILAVVLVAAVLVAVIVPCVIRSTKTKGYENMPQEKKEQYYVEEFKEKLGDKDTLLVGTAISDDETGETKMLASTPNGTDYAVFFDKDGKMTDSRYSVTVSKKVNKYLDGELKELLGDYVIKGSLVVSDVDACKLNEKSSFEDVQKTNGYTYGCQIFVNEKKRDEVTEDDIKWVFEKANINAYVEVLFVPRVEGMTLEQSPSTGATFTFHIEKADNNEK